MSTRLVCTLCHERNGSHGGGFCCVKLTKPNKNLQNLEVVSKPRTEYFGARRCGMWVRRTEEIWCIFEREARPHTASPRPKDAGRGFETASINLITRSFFFEQFSSIACTHYRSTILILASIDI